MLEGCHPEPGVVGAVRTERCGRPVFAPIEVGRLMMRVEQRQDAMYLWRSFQGLELVGCRGGPWVVKEGEPGEERNRDDQQPNDDRE